MKVNKTMIAVILALLLAAPVTVMLADAAPTRNANSYSGNTYDCGNAVDTDWFTVKFYHYTGTSTSKEIDYTGNESLFEEIDQPFKDPTRIIYTPGIISETIPAQDVVVPAHGVWEQRNNGTATDGYYEWVEEWSRGHYERHNLSRWYSVLQPDGSTGRYYDQWVESPSDELTYGHYVFHDGSYRGRYNQVAAHTVHTEETTLTDSGQLGYGPIVAKKTYMVIEGTSNNTSFSVTPEAWVTQLTGHTVDFEFKIGNMTDPVASGATLTGFVKDKAYLVSAYIDYQNLRDPSLSQRIYDLTVCITAENNNYGKNADSVKLIFRTPLEAFQDDLEDLNASLFEDQELRLTTNTGDGIGVYVESEYNSQGRHYITPGNQTSAFSLPLTVPTDERYSSFYLKLSTYFADIAVIGTDNGTSMGASVGFNDEDRRGSYNYSFNTRVTMYVGYDGGNLILYNTEAEAQSHPIPVQDEHTVVMTVSGHEIADDRVEFQYGQKKGVASVEFLPIFT